MKRAAQATEKTRLRAEDWVDAALERIAEDGFSAVAIEPLARRLGVTKGSFYWHFASREALAEATLAEWEERDRATFERTIELVEDPAEKLRALFRRTRQEIPSHVLFSRIFAASEDPLVRPVMQRVCVRRIEYLERGFRDLGMAAQQAHDRARLALTSYLGFLQFFRLFRDMRLGIGELENYVEHVIETLIPTPDQSEAS